MTKETTQNKASKQNIKITFKYDRYVDYGMHAVLHTDIKGYSLNGPYLIVQTDDDTQLVYPMDSVAELSLTTTKE